MEGYCREFTVWVGDRMIVQKNILGIFPTDESIVEKVRRRLSSVG